MTPSPDGWIDLSVPLRSEMPTWPDQPRAWVKPVQRLEDDGTNVSVVSVTTHTGTHLDAPLHFLEDAATIDQMPPEVGIGPAHVVEVDDLDQVREDAIEEIPDDARRVLFKTDNSDRCWRTDDFVEDYVHLSTEAAHALVDLDVDLVGIDYLSVGGYEGNIEEVHDVLFRNGVWILEGLTLSQAPAGVHQLACLPLRVEDGDGAPARAVLRPREDG